MRQTSYDLQTCKLESWTALQDIRLGKLLGVPVDLSPFRFDPSLTMVDRLTKSRFELMQKEARLELMQKLLRGVREETIQRNSLQRFVDWQQAKPHDRVLRMDVDIRWIHPNPRLHVLDYGDNVWQRGVSLPRNLMSRLSSTKSALTLRQQELIYEKEEPKLVVGINHVRHTLLADGTLTSENLVMTYGDEKFHKFVELHGWQRNM